MIVYKPIDIEDECRVALKDYMTAYVRPLPKDFETPSILISQTGGSTSDTIDSFTVTIQSRSRRQAEAVDILNNAIAILEQVAKNQTTKLRYVTVNSMGSWGVDPVRPDLSLCSATMLCYCHREKVEV